MKKTLIISIVLILIIVIVLIINLTPTAYISYDSDTGKTEFHLKKGWSTIPIISGDNFGNDCDVFEGKEFVGAMWLWSPTEKKYYHIGEASKSAQFKQDFENKYYHTAYGGLWVYLTRDCNIWINDYSKLGPDNFKIASGWQLFAKHPTIADKGFDVFNNCNIEKFNKWDNDKQKWLYNPTSTDLSELKTKFEQATIGEVFFMKFSSECQLDLGLSDLLPQPPALE